jgi:hypothetical protein
VAKRRERCPFSDACQKVSGMSLRDGGDVSIRRMEVSVYTVPTDSPESDGTLDWDSTTLILVRAFAGDEVGLVIPTEKIAPPF